MPSGVYDHYKQRKPKETRTCAALDCNITFVVKVTSERKYCCISCSKRNRQRPPFTIEWIENMSNSRKNRVLTEETIEKIRAFAKKQWEDPEYRERQLKAILEGSRVKPNKAEKRLNKLLQEILPREYQINVKAEVMILGGRCPDFVNVNGQKKIIEMNGDWWHGEERTGVPNEQHERERIDYFAQFGWETLIVWEHELENFDLLINKVLEFNKR